ncbi:putative nuclease of restriction endonuclease-like (RecB) superfamily [Arcicella aurantiaca]|uniref:Putative nuclease of restriction endonuclease-like (RecB) superfamily n=1 Tax=Arcicella aurantiaca TaxID=591202 RepID=A0A316EE46_9BACT|nr:PDDEXK nuclease domain-containing protein [Arcicella aurantiaca]PWK28920.1 putative nuclease of restriction endonuclease-like (RecB) superfamily [Arcicella aurantiaca]
MNFEQLINSIESTHIQLSSQAVKQVNSLQTIRNWLIGCYIVEFEQKGEDRATYGKQLLLNISEQMKSKGNIGFSDRNLRQFRQFYLTYPQIWQTVSAKFKNAITQSVSEQLKNPNDDSYQELMLPVETLINTLSFSHFIELLRLDSDLKRRFYEIETVKNAWKVRELERAIDTLLFERTGLSTDKKGVIAKIKDQKPFEAKDIVRNPYFLEFIGLEEKSQYSETDLETAIINHLQSFLTELGRGFCYEARQKRITFGNTHYRIDLVFYHRVLKCHVLIDLKLGKFDHADSGQMLMYLNYFRKNEMTEGDNPPVGIILCADKDDALVEYATAGLENELFISKYMLQLPDKQTLLNFIEQELKNQ